MASARRSLGFSVNPQTSRETMPTVSASHVLPHGVHSPWALAVCRQLFIIFARI